MYGAPVGSVYGQPTVPYVTGPTFSPGYSQAYPGQPMYSSAPPMMGGGYIGDPAYSNPNGAYGHGYNHHHHHHYKGAAWMDAMFVWFCVFVFYSLLLY
jgi:hypothetical protein